MENYIRRGIALFDNTIFHDCNSVSQPQGFVKIMRDKQYGFIQYFLQPQKFILHFFSDQWVEC